MGHSQPLFHYFRPFNSKQQTVNKWSFKKFRWLELNPGPLVTTLQAVPQSLTKKSTTGVRQVCSDGKIRH